MEFLAFVLILTLALTVADWIIHRAVTFTDFITNLVVAFVVAIILRLIGI